MDYYMRSLILILLFSGSLSAQNNWNSRDLNNKNVYISIRLQQIDDITVMKTIAAEVRDLFQFDEDLLDTMRFNFYPVELTDPVWDALTPAEKHTQFDAWIAVETGLRYIKLIAFDIIDIFTESQIDDLRSAYPALRRNL